MAVEVCYFLQNGPRNIEPELDHVDSVATFNSSRYLSVANLVSRRLPELVERDIVAAFTPRVPSHYRLRIGMGSTILHYFYLLPVVVQDFILHFVCTISLHVLLLFQIFASMNFTWGGFESVFVIILVIVIIGLIFLATLTEYFSGLKINESTLLEDYGDSPVPLNKLNLTREEASAYSISTSDGTTASLKKHFWARFPSVKYFWESLHAKFFAAVADASKIHPDSAFMDFGYSSTHIDAEENRIQDVGGDTTKTDNYASVTEVGGIGAITDSMDQLQAQVIKKKDSPDDFLKNPFDGTVTLARHKKKSKGNQSGLQCILQ